MAENSQRLGVVQNKKAAISARTGQVILKWSEAPAAGAKAACDHDWAARAGAGASGRFTQLPAQRERAVVGKGADRHPPAKAARSTPRNG